MEIIHLVAAARGVEAVEEAAVVVVVAPVTTIHLRMDPEARNCIATSLAKG